MSEQPDPIVWANGLIKSYNEFWKPALAHIAAETGLSEDGVWHLWLSERFSSLIQSYREVANEQREWAKRIGPYLDKMIKHIDEEEGGDDWKKPPGEHDLPL